MKRRLSKSEIKGLNPRLAAFGLELSKKEEIDLVEDEEGVAYLVNGKPAFFEADGEFIPHLKLLLERPAQLKRVTVDMGAVRFVVNGADIMRPGITAIEEGIAEGELVAVVDERHGKPLAVGKALLDTERMRDASAGKAVKTLHWVGDKRWPG